MADVTGNIRVILGQLAHVGVINEEAIEAITQIVEKEFTTWRETIAEELRNRISNWEALELTDSIDIAAGSLYTLGLRQAVDLVTGTKPLEEPPVLETDAEVELPDEDG